MHPANPATTGTDMLFASLPDDDKDDEVSTAGTLQADDIYNPFIASKLQDLKVVGID